MEAPAKEKTLSPQRAVESQSQTSVTAEALEDALNSIPVSGSRISHEAAGNAKAEAMSGLVATMAYIRDPTALRKFLDFMKSISSFEAGLISDDSRSFGSAGVDTQSQFCMSKRSRMFSM